MRVRVVGAFDVTHACARARTSHFILSDRARTMHTHTRTPYSSTGRTNDILLPRYHAFVIGAAWFKVIFARCNRVVVLIFRMRILVLTSCSFRQLPATNTSPPPLTQCEHTSATDASAWFLCKLCSVCVFALAIISNT